jgi:uncharacterized Zn finger protein (UPF0148 family)
MSDGFDKEAEREKLREKFAEDEKKREHTQRMSELLLQGATMTNRHCETCGDPIFRNDGQEFCPTCHATDDGYEMPANGAGDASENGEADATTGSAAQNAADTGSSADEPAGIDAVNTTDAGQTADEPSGGGPTESGPARGGPTESGPARGEPARSDPVRGDDGREAPVDAATPRRETERSAGAAGRTTAAEQTGDLAEARGSLTRTVTRFARAAAETDDPRRAREHLQAAREAAEALSALER